MIPIECTRLLLLRASEYPHVDHTRLPIPPWQIILADVPYMLGCEALQDWVDGDVARNRCPRAGQLREVALRLKPQSECFDREWAPIRVGSWHFRARLHESAGQTLWAAYGLNAPSIEIYGSAPNLLVGVDTLRATLAAEIRRLDSVRVPLSVAEVRSMLREAVAS